MKVISKLAEIDFRFGAMRRERDLLVIESHPESKMASTVYVSPGDVLAALGRLLTSPGALLFLLALPYFAWRWRRSDKALARTRTAGDYKANWPRV